MRGYELQALAFLLLVQVCYESPCGVMSSWFNMARIDRTTCYESPCGVMSPLLEFVNRVFHELRIPMRGYEHSSTVALSNPSHVTNPHAWL